MTDFNEKEVLARAIEGDTESFSAIYEEFVERIYNYIYYRVGNSFDAEDLTAKVFHRALTNIGKYKNRGVPFSAWLYRIAHNLVANWYRDNSRRKEVPIEDHMNLQQQSNLPEQELVHNQDNEKLLFVIRKLPPKRQQLLILKYVERMSNAEIAMIMGRSEGAIKSLYHRTLVLLRKELNRLDE
ncbi:MAG: sigma-70 family RNA polymerase sigma factor [Anaerolineaceae bacterium]|nr:sigma-70 family RNA polymerase sigma factor [Anaerolineaceae bacterium]